MNATNKRILFFMRDIIEEYLDGKLDREGAVDKLFFSLASTDLEAIYDIDVESIIADCYHSIMHLTEKGYETTDFEMAYFRDCINGVRVYNLDEKMDLTRKFFETEN